MLDDGRVSIPITSISHDGAACESNEDIIFQQISADSTIDDIGESQNMLNTIVDSSTTLGWLGNSSYTCGCWGLPDPTSIFIIYNPTEPLIGPFSFPMQPGLVYVFFTNVAFTCGYRNIQPPTPGSIPSISCPSSVSPTPSPMGRVSSSPSESHNPEATQSSGAFACFPADVTVQLPDFSTKRMDSIKVGDIVRVADNRFSKIFMFTHKLRRVRSVFVQICCEQACIRLSPGHFIYLKHDKLVLASSVKVGDEIQLVHSSSLITEGSVVRSVSFISAMGLYNPHTLNGDIIVNGIRASTYTSAVAPTLAHSLLTPLRLFFRLHNRVSSLSQFHG